MGLYEIMLIIHPEVEKDDQEEVLNGLTSTITKQGGSVSTVLDWRKRKLAYEINKLREGQYYLVYFSGEGTIIPELEHYFRVTDAIMRYMIIAVDEKDYEAAAEKAAADAAAAEATEAAEAADGVVEELDLQQDADGEEVAGEEDVVVEQIENAETAVSEEADEETPPAKESQSADETEKTEE